MMYHVIFDTNCINSDSLESFFGGRMEFDSFVSNPKVKVLLPQMLIEELKTKKRKQFATRISQLNDKFIKNNLLTQDALEKITTFRIEEHLEKMLDFLKPDKIEIIDIEDSNEAFKTIKDFAIRNEPPFNEGSDKVFKDACIYCTVNDYVKKNAREKIFVVTKDQRLKDALGRLNNINVVTDYSDFSTYLVDQYQEEYFLNTLKETFTESSNIILRDLLFNIDDLDLLIIDCDGKEYRVLLDKRVIIRYEESSKYQEKLDQLLNSGSFAATHSNLADFLEYTDFISAQEISYIISKVEENSQIRAIVSDEDVKEFILMLYEAAKLHKIDLNPLRFLRFLM